MKITPFRARLIGAVGSRALRLMGRSWNITLLHINHYNELRRSKRPFLAAFWHRFILPLAFTHRQLGAAVLISQHGDGELISAVVQRMGYRPVRGSSTRGGARAVLELAREPYDVVAITPDGPRGPSGSVQPGIAWLAAHSRRLIVPVGAAVSSAWYCRSWDRFVIPKPGSRVALCYGEPMDVPADLSDDQVPETCERVRRAMERCEQEAGAHLIERRPL